MERLLCIIRIVIGEVVQNSVEATAASVTIVVSSVTIISRSTGSLTLNLLQTVTFTISGVISSPSSPPRKKGRKKQLLQQM
jgi:hypothetical protein